MKETKDKLITSQDEKEYTAIQVFTGLYPEIFTFFKEIYDKRKAELKAKLANRPTKEEKEILLTDEREKIRTDFETHPLFELYSILSKPYLEIRPFLDSVLAVIPQTKNIVTSETDLKAQETLESIIKKYAQPDSKADISDFGTVLKELAQIPEGSIGIKSIAESKDSLAALGYHLIKMEGDNYYLKFIIRKYNEVQEAEIKLEEIKKGNKKNELIDGQKDQDDLETLVQSSVRKVLDEQGIEAKEPVDEIMSAEQASQYLNLAKQTIYGFTSKNEIPFFKRGKKLYFKKSELEQWLMEGKQKTLKDTQKEAIDYINKKKK